jgi:hypothetical protein
MGENQNLDVELERGADEIMATLSKVEPLSDVQGESGTNVGGMIERVRQTMADVTEKSLEDVKIRDVLAVDCQVPQQVEGGIADEFSTETATGLAVMVDTDRLLMERVAESLSEEIEHAGRAGWGRGEHGHPRRPDHAGDRRAGGGHRRRGRLGRRRRVSEGEARRARPPGWSREHGHAPDPERAWP